MKDYKDFSNDDLRNAFESLRKFTFAFDEIQCEVHGIELELAEKYDSREVIPIDTADRHALRLCKILRYFKIVE